MVNEYQIINNVKITLGFNVYLKTQDRYFLELKIFPFLNKIKISNHETLLFIGVAAYTKHYYQIINYKTYTIDLHKNNTKYGNGIYHTHGNAIDLSKIYNSNNFNVIIANGLLGYGINNLTDFNKFLFECFKCIANGGMLVIGFNNNIDHIDFDISNSNIYKLFHGFTPNIDNIKSFFIEINPINNHTFIFLKRNEFYIN